MTDAEADALAMGVALTLLIEAKESGEFSFPAVITMTDSTGYEFLNHSWDGEILTFGSGPPDWCRISLPITVEVFDANENCHTIEVTQTDIDRTLDVVRKGQN